MVNSFDTTTQKLLLVFVLRTSENGRARMERTEGQDMLGRREVERRSWRTHSAQSPKLP